MPRRGHLPFRTATSRPPSLIGAREWHGRGVTVNVFDPGLMPGTGLTRGYGGPVRWLWAHVLPVLAWLQPDFASPPARSGAHLAQLVTEPEYEAVTGTYFEQGGRHTAPRIGKASALAQDSAMARELWLETLALLPEVGYAVPSPPIASPPGGLVEQEQRPP